MTIGFSPCPNDTFIFDALVNGKIDTVGLNFDVVLEDVETLNQWAIAGNLDITKLSYGVLPLVLDKYKVLNCGSALGRGVGPLLIRNKKRELRNVEESSIALPGEHTTAHLLFSMAYPNAKNKVFLRYDQIEDFVLSGKGHGVIIHENRFTYQQKGLIKIVDLGEYWEKETQHPIPLGGIVIKNRLDDKIKKEVDRLIGQSIEYAYTKYPELNDYIRSHSQEMSETVMRQHIDLYVNDFTIRMGEEGKEAVNKLLDVYKSQYPGTEFSITDIFV